MSGNLCKYNGTDIKQFLFISADSTLNQFFPYTTLEGSLEEVLTTPDKVAVNKRFAHRLFGNHSGIGEILEIINEEGQSKVISSSYIRRSSTIFSAFLIC